MIPGWKPKCGTCGHDDEIVGHGQNDLPCLVFGDLHLGQTAFQCISISVNVPSLQRELGCQSAMVLETPLVLPMFLKMPESISKVSQRKVRTAACVKTGPIMKQHCHMSRKKLEAKKVITQTELA